MAIMPNIEAALNEPEVYGSVARRMGNKILYDATQRAVKTALSLGLQIDNVGTNDAHNEMLAKERQRELDNEFFRMAGLSDEPDDDVKPFLTVLDGKNMIDFRLCIWIRFAKAGIRIYRPAFETVMFNRMRFYQSEPTQDTILAERRKLIEEGRTSEEVSGLPDSHFVRIIQNTRKRLAKYDNDRFDSALRLFTKWEENRSELYPDHIRFNVENDMEPLLDSKVILRMDKQARNRAYNDCLKNGLELSGKSRITANTDKVLMESLYDDCAGDYLLRTV